MTECQESSLERSLSSTAKEGVDEMPFENHVLWARHTELDIASTMALVEVVRKIAVPSGIHMLPLVEDTEMTTFDTSPEMWPVGPV
jgi:hypothetical protein